MQMQTEPESVLSSRTKVYRTIGLKLFPGTDPLTYDDVRDRLIPLNIDHDGQVKRVERELVRQRLFRRLHRLGLAVAVASLAPLLALMTVRAGILGVEAWHARHKAYEAQVAAYDKAVAQYHKSYTDYLKKLAEYNAAVKATKDAIAALTPTQRQDLTTAHDLYYSISTPYGPSPYYGGCGFLARQVLHEPMSDLQQYANMTMFAAMQHTCERSAYAYRQLLARYHVPLAPLAPPTAPMKPVRPN
jgi:hypothetical protein